MEGREDQAFLLQQSAEGIGRIAGIASATRPAQKFAQDKDSNAVVYASNGERLCLENAAGALLHLKRIEFEKKYSFGRVLTSV